LVPAEIFGDLVAEQDRLETILSGLGPDAWQTASGADGWAVADVVLHLAQTEEAVVASASGKVDGLVCWGTEAGTLDDAMNRMVSAERSTPTEAFQRWRAARHQAVTALRQADPQTPIQWAATPLRPSTLATTRLAEHWAHGLDITGPLGIPFPDTDRLRYIAWLAHSTLPFAFTVAGQEPHDVLCELTAPDGTTLRYGPSDADSTITGSLGAFCRVEHVGSRQRNQVSSRSVRTGQPRCTHCATMQLDAPARAGE
jgi:uncharacterized protein (TIGR03084 family)